jgi:hypothetical protein
VIADLELPWGWVALLRHGETVCYFQAQTMSKIVEQWLLFEYVGLEFTPLGLSTGASLSHHGSHGIFFASVSDITSNVVAYARSASTLIDSALPLCTNVADSTAEPGRFTSFPGPTTL